MDGMVLVRREDLSSPFYIPTNENGAPAGGWCAKNIFLWNFAYVGGVTVSTPKSKLIS